MEKILSIIIPAYNVENYLEQCLSSLKVDTILDEIEVLVINDGSKDKTLEIASKYCKEYPETYYVYTKENGGHGSTINYGIQYARGKYCKVLDGDDWLNTEELETFIELLKNQDSDIVASDYLCIQDGTGEILARKSCTNDKRQYDKICHMPKGEVHTVIKMHALTIRTSFLKNMSRKIDEHCFYVDSEYIVYPIPAVDSVYFTSLCIYMYRLGRNGQSVDIKSMQKNRAQHMKVFNSLLDFYDTLDNIPQYTKQYIERCIGQIVENQFQIYISMGLQRGIRKELQQWDCRLKRRYPAIYKSTNKKSITMLRMTGYFVLKPSALFYKLVKR